MQSLGSDIEELYDAVGLRAVYREDGGVGPWLGALIGNCEMDEIEKQRKENSARRILEQGREVWQGIGELERREHLDWIGEISTAYEYEAATHERYPDTCTWFKSNELFLDWFSQYDDDDSMAMSRFLWLRGGPGTGKTVLSASIINYLETNSIYPTAYLFCTHADIRKRQTSSIVQSLIHQLATRCEAAFEASYKFQSKATRAGLPVELVSWELFAKVLEAGGTCDLVIDGLDKCLDNDLTGRPKRNWDSSALGRPSKRHDLGSSTHIISEYDITTLDIAEDIKKVAEALTSARISDINRQRMVAERLERDCNGMFSRLKLDAARLSPDANQAYQECIVNTFFPDPHAVYDKNLDGGAALKRNNQRRAPRVLRWVIFVFRTLSVVELLHGLEMHNCRRSKDFLWVNLSNLAENMFALDRLTPSATTLKVRSTTSYGSTAGWALNLDDLSAKEFLARGQDELDFPYMGEDIPLNRSGDHGILHRCCFEYLFILLVKEPSERFMRYCVEHWLDHFNQTTSESRSACVHLQRTLLIPGPEFHTFVPRTYAIPLKSKECGWTLPDADEITPLDVACRFGLLEISMELLEKCPTVPPRILKMAAFYGNEDALRLLLDREDVSANMCSDREIASPLYIAAYNGHHLIVESLLRREEADVNRCWSHGSTPLYIASERGDDKVVELLLQSPDILVNQPRDTDFSTPLHAAVGWGRG
ncbi:uncharacterized protein H6S33_004890 [Morchella sextelata]|uniref:uncharacterized protein n=1 Tax=Morchella sextelata TaxID=1174677 RepID=UPI001D0495EE|nr:uncharacterized protein H6S33_004890 [Morchella sextelata]KAH0605668.1 hypothetical protein H6S33_004890 [Morchella sextelata]